MNARIVFAYGWGPEEEGRLSSLLYMVETATTMDMLAAVFFFADAAVLGRKGAFAGISQEIGERLDRLRRNKKAKLYVCEQAARRRGITEETVEDGMKIIGYATFLDMAASAKTVITI
ncbi:MAG: DsrE family protein [Candidatus Bathyarchaeota archaeon]|nr:MAG: DsrE family protein [Candidatus Bathyarchaeota archaeon]